MARPKSPQRRNQPNEERLLKVLTLNCWGLIFTKDFRFRICSIAKKLSKSDYDLVVLQEIFSNRDINHITESVKHNLPHVHYFYSGYLGSGVMMLSKYQLKDTMIVPYTQSGMLYHYGGDWFSAKSICHAIIRPWCDCPPIHVFGTHSHAAYDHLPNNEIRALQLFQLARMVQNITRPNEPVILMGDLNTQSFEIGIRYLLHNCDLKDSCFEIYGEKSAQMFTCAPPDGAYLPWNYETPTRIDYVLYSNHFDCEDCRMNFERIEDSPDKSYSDHKGVQSIVKLKPPTSFCEQQQSMNRNDLLNAKLSNEMMAQLEAGYRNSYFSFHHFVWILLLASPLAIISTMFGASAGFTMLLVFCSLLFLLIAMLTVYVCQRNQRRIFMAAICELKSTLDM